MRYYLKIIIFTLFLLLPFDAYCKTSQIEITSYNVEVSMEPSNNQLSVLAVLKLQKPDTINKFELLLTSDAKIYFIKSRNNNKWTKIQHIFKRKDTLSLMIQPELKASRELIIKFKYALQGKELKDLIFLDRGHRWYPLIPDQIAKFKLTAKVPHNYVVFSAGDLVEKKTFHEYSRFIWESKIPVFKLPLIIAKTDIYKETVKDVNGKKIYFYSSTIDEKTIEKIMSEACSSFEFYSRFIGEYPHNRLTLLEFTKLMGADIACGLLMLGKGNINGFKKDHYESLNFAIATQWFAAGVFFKFLGKGFWFFEISLPHYLRLMYLEQTEGKDAFVEGLQRGLNAYKEIAGTDKELPIIEIDFPDTKEKGRVLYGKGPWLLNNVRNLIGDENWGEFIKNIYKDFCGKILTYDEFMQYLSIYDKKGSSTLMLKKWLTKTGIPEE